jgi:hypothetical protein
MSITIIVEGSEHELNPKRDTRIDDTNLDMEFVRLPYLIEQYATLTEQAHAELAQAKYDLDCVYAIQDAIAREEMAAAEVKVTEKKVESTVITSKRYRKEKAVVLDRQRTYGILKATLGALYVKKECLISIAANQRAANQFMSKFGGDADDVSRSSVGYRKEREFKKERSRQVIEASSKRKRYTRRKKTNG